MSFHIFRCEFNKPFFRQNPNVETIMRRHLHCRFPFIAGEEYFLWSSRTGFYLDEFCYRFDGTLIEGMNVVPCGVVIN